MHEFCMHQQLQRTDGSTTIAQQGQPPMLHHDPPPALSITVALLPFSQGWIMNEPSIPSSFEG
jgi:hypothetical protein